MNKSIGLFSLTAILLVFSGLLIVVIKAAPSETGESASSKPLAVQATKSTPENNKLDGLSIPEMIAEGRR